jgi:polyisoprenoid-binding protein YceI
MSVDRETHILGPGNARLIVHTTRTGAAAKAGHDLAIEVTSWSGTLDLSPAQATVALRADGGSLRVLEGRGGMKSLDEDDRASIHQTIDDDVLKGTPIQFRSTAVKADPDGVHLHVDGQLELAGASHPVSFGLALRPAGRLTGSARIRQTDWGIKPYSALFGALKVVDEVEVAIDADLTSTDEPKA